MEIKEIGTKRFDGLIDVTDPCYDADSCGRLNGLEFVPGEYSCYVEYDDITEWGERICRIGITAALYKWCEYKLIGCIGVDAGLAGFFQNKPDYTDEQWMSFCDRIKDGNAWLFDEGFFSSSGYGDGEYGVYAAKGKDGKYVAAYIEFIDPAEEDDEEEDYLIHDNEEWEDGEDE